MKTSMPRAFLALFCLLASLAHAAPNSILHRPYDLDIEPVGVLPRNPDFALLGRAYGCAVRQPQDLDELERDLRAGFGQPGVTLIELRHACAR